MVNDRRLPVEPFVTALVAWFVYGILVGAMLCK